MYIVGIDPGKQGSVCLVPIDSSKPSCLFYALPYNAVGELDFNKCDWINVYKGSVKTIVIETPFIMPGNKNKGLMTQLSDYGALVAIMRYVFGYDNVVTVMAKQWKSKLSKYYNVVLDKDKATSIALAKQLNSSIVLRANSRCRVDDDNMAEAYLLANYGLLL
jgi:hypothetical protein